MEKIEMFKTGDMVTMSSEAMEVFTSRVRCRSWRIAFPMGLIIGLAIGFFI